MRGATNHRSERQTLAYTTLLREAGSDHPTLVRVFDETDEHWKAERLSLGHGASRVELLPKTGWSRDDGRPEPAPAPPAPPQDDAEARYLRALRGGSP